MTRIPHLMPQATYFFTLRLAQPGSDLLTTHIESLRFAYARTLRDYPVICHAMVVLPDHLHAIWTEPPGGVWYAQRWRHIKARFTMALPETAHPCLTDGRKASLWQRRFQEHALRSEADLRCAMTLCQENPVKHGLVSDAALWPYSSFTKNRAKPTLNPKPANLAA